MAVKRRSLSILGAVGVAFLGAGIWCARGKARGEWAPEFAGATTLSKDGDRRVLRGLRDFSWTADGPRPFYRDFAFKTGDVVSLRLAVVPLSARRRGPAHLMLSFGLANGDAITVSAEARRRRGESYSPWRGLCRRYELMYVVSTERDALDQRTVGRGQTLYLYPLRAEPAAVRRLLDDMLARAAALTEKPEFYNTAFNNCAQNIRRHVNTLVDRPFGHGWRFLLPGFLDKEVAARGLFALEGSPEDLRVRCRVAPPAGPANEDPPTR
ncbi:MAG: DUF4105 domain-containing protein [Elusimicrobia bacterium]|nr:DUF4105 domain-containing protein [Elusimicrobiota bacterium]